MKEFWKSVDILRSYRQEFGVSYFFDSRCKSICHTIHQQFLCLVSTIPLPFCRCRFAVPVSRCRFRFRCRCRCVCFCCNGTEFSYVIFTEQRNFTTAERRNGNGRTATEWWKPGITQTQRSHALARRRKEVIWQEVSSTVTRRNILVDSARDNRTTRRDEMQLQRQAESIKVRALYLPYCWACFINHSLRTFFLLLHPKFGWNGGRVLFSAENLQYPWNGAR